MVHLNEQIQNNKVFIIVTNIKHDVVEGQNDWKLSTQPSFSVNIFVFWANKFCKNFVKNKIDFLFVCLFIYLDEANTSLSIINTEIDCKRNLLEPCGQKDFEDTFFIIWCQKDPNIILKSGKYNITRLKVKDKSCIFSESTVQMLENSTYCRHWAYSMYSLIFNDYSHWQIFRWKTYFKMGFDLHTKSF